MFKYKIPESDQYIIFTEKVMSKIKKFKQKDNLPENGGILFARFNLPEISIEYISLPTKYDIKEKYKFCPNKKQQQKIIKQMEKKDLHYVGEWHTHPQKIPLPSELDLDSMKDRFNKSIHELNYFIMFILGNSTNDKDNWISIHNGKTYIELKNEKGE